MAQDYYQTLGVAKTASSEEIKKAYRKLAHQHHPDKDRGNEQKFKEINEAYQVLSDPNKRQQYDRFGTNFQNAGAGQGFGGFDFSNFSQGFGNVEFDDAFDIFSDIFGGGRTTTRQPRRARGVNLEMELDLTFNEAVFGAEKEISLEKKDTCEHCQGSGAEPGSKISTCPKCHGSGQIKTTRRTIFGQMQSVSTCDECDGNGKVAERACHECKGSGHKRRTKHLKVRIPAGVEDGQRIRITNEGEVGYKGSNFGDLYLRLHVASSSKFKREGGNVYSEAAINFSQAALGTTINVETVDGKVKMKVPAGTQSGKVFRLKSHGAPILNGSGRGDHFVTVAVTTPSKLSKKDQELFMKLAEEHDEAKKTDEGFWGKFK
ncbi:MAG: molecular chaperone DnaJ [Candidatus Doudnabacteria bacterium RIFCSPHIGHO2_01_FULL_45_18]|uniref:Chaperone protein DnaJ n=1 Tax=Candidatus Doudnabacteria bacterium RIFCSPHIGHO2_01_FULL_45_18 TaxID=1817823 RepID=A0A1F5NRJ0_9BACT|nr:MAG: molecular chaperone DnaJ [Candidatus Doudnabacteria bacterium RIFCSPHIGHO2_01_FULL_45_18]